MSTAVYKDDILDSLASHSNVARFASFAPDGRLRRAVPPLADHATVEGAAASVMRSSASGMVNVRTFRPEAPEGNPFIYGIVDAAAAAQIAREHMAAGYHVIINEAIPTDDGGVSGVAQAGVVEVVPGATPRGVETSDPAALPADVAAEAIRLIFGVDITSALLAGERTEFSVHPYRCGAREEPVILWERRPVEASPATVKPSWPNSLSRFVGDKAYGLLMAHLYGARVPRTTVVSRNVAPFTFGTPTGEPRRWARAVPAVKLPGELPTYNRWVDPFGLADECGTALTSILSQDEARAAFAGAALVTSDAVTVEGAAGSGDAFMLGATGAATLPDAVRSSVTGALVALREHFGTFSAEWVYDRSGDVWIVQVNQLSAAEVGEFTEADAQEWVTFDGSAGVEALRTLLAAIDGRGVRVTGAVGLTSHIGDILRRSGVPFVFAGRNL